MWHHPGIIARYLHNLHNSISRATSSSTPSLSSSTRHVTMNGPSCPVRAVRPHRCRCISALAAGRYCTTWCRSGKSIPRAARSCTRAQASPRKTHPRHAAVRFAATPLPEPLREFNHRVRLAGESAKTTAWCCASPRSVGQRREGSSCPPRAVRAAVGGCTARTSLIHLSVSAPRSKASIGLLAHGRRGEAELHARAEAAHAVALVRLLDHARDFLKPAAEHHPPRPRRRDAAAWA